MHKADGTEAFCSPNDSLAAGLDFSPYAGYDDSVSRAGAAAQGWSRATTFSVSYTAAYRRVRSITHAANPSGKAAG